MSTDVIGNPLGEVSETATEGGNLFFDVGSMSYSDLRDQVEVVEVLMQAAKNAKWGQERKHERLMKALDARIDVLANEEQKLQAEIRKRDREAKTCQHWRKANDASR